MSSILSFFQDKKSPLGICRSCLKEHCKCKNKILLTSKAQGQEKRKVFSGTQTVPSPLTSSADTNQRLFSSFRGQHTTTRAGGKVTFIPLDLGEGELFSQRGRRRKRRAPKRRTTRRRKSKFGRRGRRTRNRARPSRAAKARASASRNLARVRASNRRARASRPTAARGGRRRLPQGRPRKVQPNFARLRALRARGASQRRARIARNAAAKRAAAARGGSLGRARPAVITGARRLRLIADSKARLQGRPSRTGGTQFGGFTDKAAQNQALIKAIETSRQQFPQQFERFTSVDQVLGRLRAGQPSSGSNVTGQPISVVVTNAPSAGTNMPEGSSRADTEEITRQLKRLSLLQGRNLQRIGKVRGSVFRLSKSLDVAHENLLALGRSTTQRSQEIQAHDKFALEKFSDIDTKLSNLGQASVDASAAIGASKVTTDAGGFKLPFGIDSNILIVGVAALIGGIVLLRVLPRK